MNVGILVLNHKYYITRMTTSTSIEEFEEKKIKSNKERDYEVNKKAKIEKLTKRVIEQMFNDHKKQSIKNKVLLNGKNVHRMFIDQSNIHKKIRLKNLK